MDTVINEKSQGQMGVFAGLTTLKSRLSPEDFQLFCENSPNGWALWLAFALKRKSPETPTEYNFFDYAQEILQGLKKPERSQ